MIDNSTEKITPKAMWKLLLNKNIGVFLNKAEINRAVFFSILTRGWNLCAAPITTLLIAMKFNPEIQGYYFTFAGILAFQFLAELGLGNLIIQFASHEWSKLSIDKSGNIVGNNKSLIRLQCIAMFAIKWYSAASIVLTIFLIIGGYYFFSTRITLVRWVFPWITLCVLNGISFSLMPIWYLLEGCNQTSSVYTYRFIQSLFTTFSLWLAIIFGAGLWTIIISSIIAISCSLFFLKKFESFIRKLLSPSPSASQLRWRIEILPLQWRLTLSWLIGSFAFTLFTPVIFQYHGPVIAGQMGMTWNIVTAMVSISSSWVSPRVSQFGILIARQEYEELDILFWRITKIVIGISALMGTTFWLIIYLFNIFENPLAQRLLPPSTTGYFLLAQFLIVVSIPFSSYMRAHKKEPFLLMVVSIMQGVLTALLTFILGKYYSVSAIAVGYLLVNIILIPLVIITWYRCRKAWH